MTIKLPRKLAALAVFCAVSTILFSTSPITLKTQAAGTITGTVYFDYNGNGVRNTGSAVLANDNGAGGVTVTVYDASGTPRGTTTSCAAANNPTAFCTGGNNGAYSLAATGTGPYRVEFTNLPAGFSPSASGANNKTTVQFIADGNASGVDLGIVNNAIYSQDNPNVVSPIQISGNPLGGGTSGVQGWLGVFPFNSSGTTAIPQTFNGTVIGATWGQAYQRSTRKLFSAALVKRHVGLGSYATDGSNGAVLNQTGGRNSGTGGVYVTDFSASTPTPAQFVSLQSLGINTGNFTVARNLPADATAPSADSATFGLVGKLGLGGLKLSEDGNTLWTVNLNNRSLVSMNVTGGTAPTAANEILIGSIAGAPTCPGGVLRPWALGFRNSKGYLGAVCSAETSGLAADLRAYVLSFNPANPGAGLTTEMNIPLDYTRGMATDRVSGSTVWFPWTDTYSDAAFRPGTISDCCSQTMASRPTPILSDIDFDNNGAMILGFTDRAGNQLGNFQQRPDGTGTLGPATGGEILRAASNGSGGYTLESNGISGSLTGSGAGNFQGPGGGEFYANDTYAAPNHNETAQGGLAQLQGGEVMTTEMDPLAYGTGGIGWMSNLNGVKSRNYQLFDSATPGGQAKANGLGDLELLADPAPIEIGNRVWRDSNGDGVQNPGENGIAGVTVRLYTAAGAFVAAAVTDAAGNYYFSSAAGTSTGNAVYGLNLLLNTGYSIRVDNPTDYATGGPLNGITPTTANTNSQAGFADGSDSDGINTVNPVGSPAGVFPVIAINTGGAGNNNHTYDFGFRTGVTAASVSVSGQVLDSRWKGIAGARVTLTTQNGSSVSVTTNSFGKFTFNEVSGQSAVLTVSAKRYTFSQANQYVGLTESTENLTFIADRQSAGSDR